MVSAVVVVLSLEVEVSEAAQCFCSFPETWDCSSKELGHPLLLIVFKVSQPSCSLSRFVKECFLNHFLTRQSKAVGGPWVGLSYKALCPQQGLNKGKFLSFTSSSPLPQTCFVQPHYLLFCGWYGQRNQNRSGTFPLLGSLAPSFAAFREKYKVLLPNSFNSWCFGHLVCWTVISCMDKAAHQVWKSRWV